MVMKFKMFHITDDEIHSVKFPHWPKLGNDVYTNPISLISPRFEGQTCLYGFTRPRCHTRTGHLLTLFERPKTWLDRSQIPFMVHQESCEPSCDVDYKPQRVHQWATEANIQVLSQLPQNRRGWKCPQSERGFMYTRDTVLNSSVIGLLFHAWMHDPSSLAPVGRARKLMLIKSGF